MEKGSGSPMEAPLHGPEQNGSSISNAMTAAAKWTLRSKRDGGRFQMVAPFRGCNGSSLTKKNQALRIIYWLAKMLRN
jgi:hypothetical protein